MAAVNAPVKTSKAARHGSAPPLFLSGLASGQI